MEKWGSHDLKGCNLDCMWSCDLQFLIAIDLSLQLAFLLEQTLQSLKSLERLFLLQNVYCVILFHFSDVVYEAVNVDCPLSVRHEC